MKRAALNVGLCVFVGILLGSAWMIFADGVLYTQYNVDAPPFVWLYALPAIGVTMSMLFLNVTSPRQMRTGGMGVDDEIHAAVCTRIWVFVMITMGFTALGGAVWVASTVYAPSRDASLPSHTWPGGAMVIHACLVLFAGIVYFMRPRPRTF